MQTSRTPSDYCYSSITTTAVLVSVVHHQQYEVHCSVYSARSVGIFVIRGARGNVPQGVRGRVGCGFESIPSIRCCACCFELRISASSSAVTATSDVGLPTYTSVFSKASSATWPTEQGTQKARHQAPCECSPPLCRCGTGGCGALTSVPRPMIRHATDAGTSSDTWIRLANQRLANDQKESRAF